jgi:hypothetical protein
MTFAGASDPSKKLPPTPDHGWTLAGDAVAALALPAFFRSRQAAEKLGVSRQAVRQKATRGRWPRTRGNDGQARIQVPEQPYRSRTVTVPVPDDQLVGSLRKHIATLKAELASERERADRAIADLTGLAQRFAALAEQMVPGPDPPQRCRAGRAWGWFLRN